jgi:TonB family protein
VWSEETREQYNEEPDHSCVSTSDETGHPIEKSGAIPTDMPAIDIKPGTVLKNRFELVSRIGGGSMADIYEAIDLRKQEAGSANSRLAIKVISATFAMHSRALETLQREALNSQALNHPNIIRVYDFNRDKDRYFMTMELLDGQSLVDTLHKNRFRPLAIDQALPITEALCNGLQHAHEQGIIHADIKPGNIFVLTTGQVKILDFGISRITHDDAERDNSLVTGAHTPAYASCEVSEGAEPTEQDDIFAMACVAYRMLAGYRAFGGLTALDAERKHIEPQRIEALNPDQWQALQQALAFRRADRTAHIDDFATLFFKPEPATRPTNLPDNKQVAAPTALEPNGLPLRFGVLAIAALLIPITLALFWPEPDPMPVAHTESDMKSPPGELINPDGSIDTKDLSDTNVFKPLIVTALPPVTDKLSKPIPAESALEPAIAAAAAIEQSDPQPDTPELSPPEPTRIDELTALADNAMNDGRLLDPADDSARLYISELTALAPDAVESQQRRTRLTELMLLEAMVAITDENFEVATRWVTETRSLGVPEETLQRFETELQKGRDAQKARQTKTLGAIFASATPAAILADPAIDFSSEQETVAVPEEVTNYPEAGAGPMTGPGSLSLAIMMPGALPDSTYEINKEIPGDESAAPDIQQIALSALEFSRYIEPKIPRLYKGRNKAGWVELSFRVTPGGRTDNITVIAAEPENRYEDAAITAVSKWRFKPVYIDGIATEKYSSVRLRFEPNK